MTQVFDTYSSISSQTEGVYKESGSRFLSFAIPVTGEEQVREHISSFRKTYHDARHCCYAYRIGREGQQWRINDDGEPSGTAGRPILGQIDSLGLSDILVVVVRYFGGVKLGVPGLIKAYRTATRDALERAVVIEKIETVPLSMSFPYPVADKVLKLVREMQGEVISQSYDTLCGLRVGVRLSLRDRFLDKASKIDELTLN